MSIVACPRCGAKNRVQDGAAEVLRPVCGRCREPLPAGGDGAGGGGASCGDGGKPVVVTDATFEREVLGAGAATPVVLDCWAPWCGPCRMLAPVLDQIAAEAGGRYRVAKLNTDENPRVAERFQISAIPTLLFFRDGKLVDRVAGLVPKEQIVARLRG